MIFKSVGLLIFIKKTYLPVTSKMKLIDRKLTHKSI